jgi:hypothetical protein
MEERHLLSAGRILKDFQYIVIATTCEDGHPWNTPVSATMDTEMRFHWGSSPENTHSKNIRKDGRTYVIVFDSHAPEGAGEGIYMLGVAEELDWENSAIRKYQFVPQRIWINDEAKNEDGTYKHDIRIELELDALRSSIP